MCDLGKYILPDGSCREGIWEDDRRLKWLDENEDFSKTEVKKRSLDYNTTPQDIRRTAN